MDKQKIVFTPLEINPLIKLVRYICLTSGIIYGFVNRRKYMAIENELREKEERERAAKEEYLAIEKKRLADAELRELERIFLGVSSDDVTDENVKFKSVGTMTDENEFLNNVEEK